MVYHPEPYWSRVAAEIAKRGTASLVAGDDDPYFRYKRQKFVTKFLLTTRFDSKVVLEVGPGPGGNLLEVVRGGAARVIGVDISHAMLAIAAERLKDYAGSVELLKTDGQKLPLSDGAADVTFTVTVLHHNTDPTMFQNLIREICRVTKETIILTEDTGKGFISPEKDWVARPVQAYAAECRKYGFRLASCQYLGLAASRLAHKLVSRLFVPRSHLEGQPFGWLPVATLRFLLTFTRPLDSLVPDRHDLTKMLFVRDSAAAI